MLGSMLFVVFFIIKFVAICYIHVFWRSIMNKRKKYVFIIFIIFLIWICFIAYRYCDEEYSKRVEQYHSVLEYIQKYPEKAPEYGDLQPPVKLAATELYAQVLRWTPLYIIQIFSIGFIIVISTYYFHKILHSGFIQNISFRKSYTTFIKTSILKMWGKAIICFLLPHILIFIICLFYSEFRLFDTYTLSLGKDFYNNFGLFCSSFVYFILYSIFCCNLGIICIKKQRKFIISLILSCLIFYFLTIYLEAGIGMIIDNLANLNVKYYPFSTMATGGVPIFSILPYYYLLASNGHWILMEIISIFTVITSCMVYLMYSDKEGVIIESEN